MALETDTPERTVGLARATGVGIGAIVGGGIMLLSGVAFENAGPSAVVAFGLNGIIALITAISFAEIASTFPESGGAYTFAKKVLSVRAAFATGWILWFAYIVAGVLYALGFAAFLAEAIAAVFRIFDHLPPPWLGQRRSLLLFAIVPTILYALLLLRSNEGGAQWATYGKVIVFIVILLGAVFALVTQPLSDSTAGLDNFFYGGSAGIVSAMGFTFIALQGFDLIAAIGGEVKNPQRTIPKAMLLSLGCALAIYLPLLLLISMVGVTPGTSIGDLASTHGETVFAVAVQQFLGTVGYWLVLVAALLSTLSALQANLMAASRVAHTMAMDRTLPPVLGGITAAGTPAMAIYATTLTLAAILFMVPNLGSAGAAASLIFLISFALTHLTAYLARSRSPNDDPNSFQSPWFPVLPIFGGLCCTSLAIFQAFAVPDAGGITVIWLGLGGILYMALFRSGAEIGDASAEALDPTLARLRGKRPLVLVPIANPASAATMVSIANAIAPSIVARVLLLTVIEKARKTTESDTELIETKLTDAQDVVRKALTTSFAGGHQPSALVTTADRRWNEIERVAEAHACQSLLLGFGAGDQVDTNVSEMENLLNRIDCDVAIMRAEADWSLENTQNILVPVGGRGEAHNLRAHFLTSLCRSRDRNITFLNVSPTSTSDEEVSDIEQAIGLLAEAKVPGRASIRVIRSQDPLGAVLAEAEKCDLLVLGLRSAGWRRRVFGDFVLQVATKAQCTTVMLSRGK